MIPKHLAAVSCSANGYKLGGAGLGFWLTGKPRCAWVVHGILFDLKLSISQAPLHNNSIQKCFISSILKSETFIMNN